MQRNGVAIGISMAIGMAIFVLAVASTFLLFQDALSPQTGTDQQTGAIADTALNHFQDLTDWTLYRSTVAIHSSHDIPHHPLEIPIVLPDGTSENTVLTMRGNREIPSQYHADDNTVVVVTNTSSGVTTLDIVHAEHGEITPRQYDTGLERQENTTWNQHMNVTVNSNGFTDISFKDVPFLEDAADIDVDDTPVFDDGPVRTHFTYSQPDETAVRVFDRSGQIRVTTAFTGEKDWEFNLTGEFTDMYASSQDDTIDLDDSGTLFSEPSDFVDFYDDEGLGIAGDDLFVTVERDTSNAPIQVTVNFSDDGGEKDVLLYAHDGNYTAALPVANAFLEPYTVSTGVPVSVTGISRDRAAAIEEYDYETVHDLLGLRGADYNITVDGVFQKGRNVPRGTVHVHEFPVPVVERFANATITHKQMRIWR